MRKKLTTLEFRILQQMLQVRQENPGATVVYKPVGPAQHNACQFLLQRGCVRLEGPYGRGKASKTYEYHLTPSGTKVYNRIRFQKATAA